MAGIRLLPEQENLLLRLIEAHNRLLPRRMPFLLLHLADGRDDETLFHEGFPDEKDHAFEGDVEALAAAGLVRTRYRNGRLEFDLTAQALLRAPQSATKSPTGLEIQAQATVEITGTVEGGRQVVRVGGSDVLLTDATFRALLVLSVRLSAGGDGWVDLDQVSNSSNPHQTISELRQKLSHALSAGGLDPSSFIEVLSKKARLSLPTTAIGLNVEELKSHPNAEVRAIVGRFDKPKK